MVLLGLVTDRYSYSLYGERTHDTGDGDHIFGYCGRDGVITERDGLLYMRARYYSPELKRFISADSVIGNLSSTPSLNRYAYANGNPVTQIDPFGLSAEPGTKKAKKNINWREAVHDALDIAGSITGYGDICDAVNAVLYLTEGDYINAGLSALSIIPGDDAFTKTGKASKVLGNGIVESGLKHLDNVADGIKKLVKKADDTIDLEKHLPKKLLTEEAEVFAKKADKVADDVVEDAAKSIKSGSGSSFTGKLRGEDVTLNNVNVHDITLKKRSSSELSQLRSEFNTSVRKNFLMDMGKQTEYLRSAGFTEADILKIQNGYVPTGWQVHHKIPLDGGGTNDFSNMVLIQNEPYHKVLTNYQNSVMKDMNEGDIIVVAWPQPNGNIYPITH